MPQIVFDDFTLDLPSVGRVQLRDVANHPNLAGPASAVGAAFFRFGATLDDNFRNCGDPTDETGPIYAREEAKLPRDRQPTAEEIASARAAIKAEVDEIEEDRKLEFGGINLMVSSGGEQLGVFAIAEAHVMRLGRGVRLLQAQGAYLQAIRGPQDFDAYADRAYELWVALLREDALTVAPGLPVHFQRWFFPNKRRITRIVRRVQERWSANEIDVVGWPRSPLEEDLGVVRTRYVTLRRP